MYIRRSGHECGASGPNDVPYVHRMTLYKTVPYGAGRLLVPLPVGAKMALTIEMSPDIFFGRIGMRRAVKWNERFSELGGN